MDTGIRESEKLSYSVELRCMTMRNVSPVVPPGFCNRGEVRYGSIGGLEYEVPQSRLYCLCINVALCSTALHCICRVIRRSSMTMKAHTYYIIFGRPPIAGKLPPSPLAAPLCRGRLGRKTTTVDGTRHLWLIYRSAVSTRRGDDGMSGVS